MFAVSYIYDGFGRLSDIVYPSDRLVTYSYSTSDPRRIESISTALSGVTGLLASNITYASDGRVTSLQLGNSATVSHTFNYAGEITALSSPPHLNRMYDHDGVGSITGIYDGVRHSTFGYDELSRLLTSNTPSVFSQLATYDLAGNRLTLDDGVNPASDYDYTPGTNKLTGVSALGGDSTRWAHARVRSRTARFSDRARSGATRHIWL